MTGRDPAVDIWGEAADAYVEGARPAEVRASLRLAFLAGARENAAAVERVRALADEWDGYDAAMYDVAVHRECASAIRAALAPDTDHASGDETEEA